MADLKISALTASTTPLAGTEVLPIVQSSTTKQVSIANLTAGRAVSALSYTSTTGSNFATTSGNSGFGYSSPAYKVDINGSVRVSDATVDQLVFGTSASATKGSGIASSGGSSSFYNGLFLNSNGNGVGAGGAQYNTAVSSWRVAVGSGSAEWAGADVFAVGRVAAGGTYTSPTVLVKVDNTGNIIPSVAAKGVNFTANTPAAGMTSQLLNWYEEGTWTPTQLGGLTVVGTFSSSGLYVRVGRQVTLVGSVTGSTSIAVSAASNMCGGIPFTPSRQTSGSANSADGTKTGTVYMGTTTINSASAIAATGTITFTITYFV